MSIPHNSLVFREPRNEQELAALFRLRYQGYLDSACAGLVNQNDLGMELDYYDFQSLHYGLFQEGRFGAHPIAYARFVEEQPSRQAKLVNELIGTVAGLEAPSTNGHGFKLPMINSCDEAEEIEQFLDGYRARKETIIEASRFVFDPAVRSGGYTRLFVEACIAATCFQNSADVVGLACHPRHAAFYMRYGFKLLIDGNKNGYNGLKASVITLTPKDIRPQKLKGIKQLGDMLNRQGVVYLPTDHMPVKRLEKVASLRA
jgi:N-acyl-L-homoserine lactone synthetase